MTYDSQIYSVLQEISRKLDKIYEKLNSIEGSIPADSQSVICAIADTVEGIQDKLSK